MAKLIFNYEQYLRILVALRRAFKPQSQEMKMIPGRKGKIDQCIVWMRQGVPESKGQEMLYMVAHLCLMQEVYKDKDLYFRADTLWRPCRFPGYVDDMTVTNYRRAKLVIQADEERQELNFPDKYIIPLPDPTDDFTGERFLLVAFERGTGIAVPATRENLLACRKYTQLEGAPQGNDLLLALQRIRNTTESQYLTFPSLIGDPTRVFKAHGELSAKPKVTELKYKVADPDGFWTSYRRMEATGAVTKAMVQDELKGNTAKRFLLDAKALGVEIS
jgi:hypothetical protein